MSPWLDDPTTRHRPEGPSDGCRLQRQVGWWGETRVGVFETIRVIRGRPVALEAHLRRLAASQRSVGRPPPPVSVRRQICEAARGLARTSAGLRVELDTLGRGGWTVRILPRGGQRPDKGRGTASARGDHRSSRRGIVVETAVARTASPLALPTQIKSIERVPSILVWGEGRRLRQAEGAAPRPLSGRRPAGEWLMCHPAGWLAEGTVSNVFVVQRGRLVTAPEWAGILPGVVRDTILALARRAKLPVDERPLTRHELYTAEEAFVTNSLIGIVPVREADGRRIRRCPGPVTRRLRRAYELGVGRGRL